jgi:hypothetical protein
MREQCGWRSINDGGRPFTHKRAFTRKNQPVGQISKSVSSPDSKNIPLSPSGKSSLEARPIPSHSEGRLAIVTDARRDAVDAAAFCVRRGCRVGFTPVSDQQHADEGCCSVRRSRVVLTPQWLASSLRRHVGPTGL